MGPGRKLTNSFLAHLPQPGFILEIIIEIILSVICLIILETILKIPLGSYKRINLDDAV